MSASPTRLAAARTDAYARQAAAIRTRVQAFASARFAAGQFYDADVARFVSQVAPIVLAGRKQTAALTDAYLSSVMKSAGITVPIHKPVDTAALRGVPVDEVLTRPFKTARAGIFTDGIDAARQAGEARLMDIIGTDMQMARTYTSRNVLSGSRAAGYMRVPSGGRTCALCEIASTQMYHTDVLMPIHPSCQCGVEIVTDSNPWDQGAADQRLEDVHAAVFDRLGTADSSGRDAGLGKKSAKDYTDIIVTNNHGEIGPVLGIRGQHFTGPSAIK